MPERLDEEQVESSLTALPHWTGDSNALSRTVAVSGQQADDLLTSLQRSAEAMNHHPDVQRREDGLLIVLSTHSAGGVTELDLAMASHIEDLVSQTTEEPAEHAHPETPYVPADEQGAGDARLGGSSPPVATPQDGERADEPGVGAASTRGGSQAVPLPSDEPGQPEPGVAEEQRKPTVSE